MPVRLREHRSPALFGVLCLALLVWGALAPPRPAAAQCTDLPPSFRAALEGVTARSLEAHISFLASDELGGRGTPSFGLDAAAAYIASRFRMAGLEPVGDDGYYQTSQWVMAPGRGTRMRPQRAEEAAGTQGPTFTLENVVGLLPGSDPVLKNTYVLVSAHYDHLGIRSGAFPDSIWNGANDNASGTSTVIELAQVLGRAGIHPKRSILFIALFGEEIGELGSHWYADHPLFPLRDTVAMVNLEQIGRTDGDGGDNTGKANLTGFALSDLANAFVEAGRVYGIDVFRHEQNSLPYFRRSDNAALADRGVVAHTLSVVYSYADYHQAGDEWNKIDYANMAREVKMIGLATLMWAHCDQTPAWNASNEDAARFLEAWKALHGGGE